MAAGFIDPRHAAGSDEFQELISVVEKFADVWIHVSTPLYAEENHGDVVRRAAGERDLQKPPAAGLRRAAVDHLVENLLIRLVDTSPSEQRRMYSPSRTDTVN